MNLRLTGAELRQPLIVSGGSSEGRLPFSGSALRDSTSVPDRSVSSAGAGLGGCSVSLDSTSVPDLMAESGSYFLDSSAISFSPFNWLYNVKASSARRSGYSPHGGVDALGSLNG